MKKTRERKARAQVATKDGVAANPDPADAKPAAVLLNRSELARRYGVALQTVDSWVRRGVPHRRKRDGGYAFDLRQVAEWRARKLAEDSQRVKGPSHRLIPEAAREWLDAIWINEDMLLPWLADPALLVTGEEYRRGEGIERIVRTSGLREVR